MTATLLPGSSSFRAGRLVQRLRCCGFAARILALDTLYVNTIALLVLFAERYTVVFRAALVVALPGFIGTVSMLQVPDPSDHRMSALDQLRCGLTG